MSVITALASSVQEFLAPAARQRPGTAGPMQSLSVSWPSVTSTAKMQHQTIKTMMSHISCIISIIEIAVQIVTYSKFNIESKAPHHQYFIDIKFDWFS